MNKHETIIKSAGEEMMHLDPLDVSYNETKLDCFEQVVEFSNTIDECIFVLNMVRLNEEMRR
jgi:hypothetical protein